MAEITASLVKELREKTGAGMMECKKALAETAGDLEQAIDFLRKKGLSVAEKKAGRVASQGLVGGIVDGNEVKMYVKVGDKVITSQYAGNPVKIDGEELSIVRQSDILAIVE